MLTTQQRWELKQKNKAEAAAASVASAEKFSVKHKAAIESLKAPVETKTKAEKKERKMKADPDA